MLNNVTNHDHSVLMAAHWSSVDALQLQEDDANQAKETLAAIGLLADSHADRRDDINADGDLSESGRESKLRSLIATSDDRLKKISAPVIEKLQAKIHEANRAMASATTVTPSMQDILRHIEVRRIAAGIDPLMLESNMRTLALNGADDQTVLAVLGASALAPLIRPAEAERVREMMAKRLQPTHAVNGDNAAQTLATITAACRTATHSFASPTYRVALGIDPVALAASAPSVPRSDVACAGA